MFNETDVNIRENWLIQTTNSDLVFPNIDKFKNVFEFIKSNYDKAISLKDVADNLGYSKAYLTTELRLITGKTVNNWIVEYRMAVVRNMLLETDMSIERIVMEVGYKNPEYLFRQFRKYHATSPNAWRKMQRRLLLHL